LPKGWRTGGKPDVMTFFKVSLDHDAQHGTASVKLEAISARYRPVRLRDGSRIPTRCAILAPCSPRRRR
jgi:hypothetical protein